VKTFMNKEAYIQLKIVKKNAFWRKDKIQNA